MKTLLPFLASIFFPGLGQIILKDYFKGILMLVICFVGGLIVPFIPYLFFYFGTVIWSLVDIYLQTEKISGKKSAVRNLIFSIVVVVIIIPAIFYLSLISFSVGGEYVANEFLNSKHTEKELVEISKELDSYFERHKKYPSDYFKFVGSKPIWSSWKTDKWDKKYRYSQSDSTNYTLTSAGKDGQFDTEDDVVQKGSW